MIRLQLPRCHLRNFTGENTGDSHPVELARPAEVITHLESLEDHAKVHSQEHYTGKPECDELVLRAILPSC